MMKILAMLLFALWLTACTPVTQTEPQTITPTPWGDDAFWLDAQSYADEMGITLEEAVARLEWQSKEVISTLQNQLQIHEADTFAGLWLQHQPEYRVVVAFTHNGEQTIRQYVTEDSDLFPLLELRDAQYSLMQLEDDQRTVVQILEMTGQPAATSILLMENHVVVEVTDRTAFDAALVEAGVALPQSVVVNTVYEPVGESPPFPITPVPDLFLPQLKQRDVAVMSALLVGELRVQDGCLRVQTEQESYLVIWQADYYLTNNNGILEILDEMGTVVAQVGERVYLGGGMQPAVNEDELRQPLPFSCSGPYWRMGGFLEAVYIANIAADFPPRTETYTSEEAGIAFDYPVGWYVHEADKALQISPNTQPTWSALFDPDQPHGGPIFDLLHNLNRQMAATPLAEVDNLLGGFAGEVEPLYPATSLRDRPDVVVGAHRFVDDGEEMVLLVGAATNPVADSSQPVVAMTAVVKQSELIEMQAIFAAILRSLRSG